MHLPLIKSISVRKQVVFHLLVTAICAFGISLQVLPSVPVPLYVGSAYASQALNIILQHEDNQQQQQQLKQQPRDILNILQQQIQNEIQLAQQRWWWWGSLHTLQQEPLLWPTSGDHSSFNNYNYNYNHYYNNIPLVQERPLLYPPLYPFVIQPQPQLQQQLNQLSSSNNSVQCVNGTCNTIVTHCTNSQCTSTINGSVISDSQECISQCSISQMETTQCLHGVCTSTFTECVNGVCNSTSTRT